MEIRQASAWSSRHTIPSDTAIGSALIAGLLEAMLEREWPSVELFHVQLAYEEAVVNAILHGNDESPDKTVEIEFLCETDRVKIRITDQGHGFVPSDVPDPRTGERLEAAGGRGLLLMTEVMSEVKYNASGNEVTLTKYRGRAE